MAVDPLRHLSVFKPNAFGVRRVDVIGCGATGSRVVLSLAKLGVENIHVWDDDWIEPHNLANQLYGLNYLPRHDSDEKVLKVDALKHLVEQNTGVVVTTHAEKVDGTQPMGDVVFVLTDTMASRKLIWEKSLKFKLRTKLMVETRMGADSGMVYSVNPNSPSESRAWEEVTQYTDEVAEVSACGASTSVGPTAEIIAGLAVWQMVRWFSIQEGGDDILDNEIIFGLRSMNTISRQFA